MYLGFNQVNGIVALFIIIISFKCLLYSFKVLQPQGGVDIQELQLMQFSCGFCDLSLCISMHSMLCIFRVLLQFS